MPFKTKCPSCGKILDVPDSAVGKKVKCPACAQMWQIASPNAAKPTAAPAKPAAAAPAKPAVSPMKPAAPAATPAVAGTKCPGCGKPIQVPDSAAGKRVKCPACSHVWQIPRRVVDAEAVPGSPGGPMVPTVVSPPTSTKQNNWFDDMASDTYSLASGSALPRPTQAGGGSVAEPPRRPCPRCGEMIAVGAAKCRFCNAIFDETLRKAKKKKRKSSSGDDDDLSVGDWIVCILCPGIGCIGGVIYLAMGKSKGWKVLGVSFLAAMIVGIIRTAVLMSTHPELFR